MTEKTSAKKSSAKKTSAKKIIETKNPVQEKDLRITLSDQNLIGDYEKMQELIRKVESLSGLKFVGDGHDMDTGETDLFFKNSNFLNK